MPFGMLYHNLLETIGAFEVLVDLMTMATWSYENEIAL